MKMRSAGPRSMAALAGIAGALLVGAPHVAAKPARTPAATTAPAETDAARCERLSTEVRKHIANVKLLEMQMKAERAAPPTSLMRTWERMNAKPEADQQQTVDQLKREREKVAILSTGLVANSCAPVDPATVKAPDRSSLPANLR